MKLLVRLLNLAMFLALWIAAYMAVHWLALRALETRDIAPGQVPTSFSVVVESREAGKAPTYDARRFRSQAQLLLAPGESLHLSKRAYDQMDHVDELTGSCCVAFEVLEDGPDGQLIEMNNDDMSFTMSRYRVRNGQVMPVAHRAQFSFYYLGYFLVSGLLAWAATRPLRRRLLARFSARAAT